MMNSKLFTMALVATVGMMTACSSDDDNATPQKQERRISVEVSERPIHSEEAKTRAPISTIETLMTSADGFMMDGIYESVSQHYAIKYESNSWKIKPNSWLNDDIVLNNTEVNFYAYTAGEFSKAGEPHITFSIPENASTQHDLLVAKNSVAFSDHDGKVPLTFDHACAALAFNVFMSNTLSTNLAGKTLTVSSIVLRNVSNTGKYYFESSSWSDVSGSAYYTLANSDMKITTTPQALSSNYLFVIPQKRDANGTTGTYLDVTYTFTGQTKTSATIPLSVNWEAGKQYTINIKLGTGLIQ
jgi:hypothetical protein